MQTYRSRLIMCMAIPAICCAVPTVRADWPNFRGPKHDGISLETGLRTVWKEPIPLVWEHILGSAYSSFACVKDKIYTCGTQDGQQVLTCMGAQTGRIIWQTPIERAYKDSMGDGTRATPTVHDGRVYILGAHGRLLCCDAADGKELWSRQFHHPPTWGYSGSVLIEGELAILSAGKDDGALVAFNRKTGDLVWKTGKDPVGYATPYPFTFTERRYVVGFLGRSAIIVEAKTGKQVWSKAWATDWDVNAAAPIFSDGYLFLTSGYRTGCSLLKLRPDGDKLAAQEVWSSKALLNKFQSCILDRGKLYASDQKALKCVDFLTGKEQWRVNRVKHGTLIMADGHFFLLDQDGRLQIAKVSPQGFSPLTTASILSGRCWAVSVIHQGRLYARNQDRVVCFDLKPDRSAERDTSPARKRATQ